jgi:PAS domain S-box-containing protein
MTRTVSVLLIEDNPGDARLVSAALAESPAGLFRLVRADRLSAALPLLAEGRVDVVLLDPGLPDSDGLDTLAAIHRAAPHTPVVVLSGSTDEQFALEIVQAHAQDYLVKDHLTNHTLTRSLRYAIERKRAQDVLRESEERLRLAMMVANEAIYEWNPVSGEVRWNETYTRNFGRAEGDHVAWWKERIHPEDAPRVISSVDAALSGRAASWEGEYRMRGADGSWANVHDRAVICRSEGGAPVRIVGAMLDITERKRAAEALEAANRQLRQLSQDLLRSQEQERRRIARELHDGTVQLLAAVEIDLCRVLDAGPLPPKQADLLREAMDLTERCTHELRTTSYLLHPPLLDDVGLAAALRSYVEGFGQRTGMSIELNLPDGGERLTAELEGTLFRIVQEALANVHRHSGSATATIKLDHAPGEVRLRIEDRGRGLPEDLSGGEQGVARFGVGLSGMRERVRLLGGTLEVASAEVGTVLQVILPVVARQKDSSASA